MRRCADAQMPRCVNPKQKYAHSFLAMATTQFFNVTTELIEVTVAADGSELSKKRVSKLSSKYHCDKKILRQSTMMANPSSDSWVCPKCSHENQDYQWCIDPECDVK